MALITFQGLPVHTVGNLPAVGTPAPDFQLVRSDLSTASLAHFKGKKIIMNIYPSIDTHVCATSVRNFNDRAAQLENTVILCISRDTPFAQNRFIEAEELSNITTLSDIRDGAFGNDYGLTIVEGPFMSLHARAVVVINEQGQVIYNEQVADISKEPDYLASIKSLTA